MKLENRIALVTGGGSGIGRAIAKLYAEEGAKVVVNDINQQTAEETVAELATEGLAIACDVADSGAVNAMFEQVSERFGRLDVLVNNAGIAETAGQDPEALLNTGGQRFAEAMSGQPVKTHWRITETMADADWRRMLAVHLDGAFYCTRAALPLMTGDGCSIINMSSVAGLGGIEVAPHYGAAKAGMLGLTKSLAAELGSRNIRVNAICPGWIETPMTSGINDMIMQMIKMRTPLGRSGQPSEIATVAVFLACDDSSFMTGQWVSPNGGFFIG